MISIMNSSIDTLKNLPSNTPVGRFQLGGLINTIESGNDLTSIYDELTNIAGKAHGFVEDNPTASSVIGLIVAILVAGGFL